MRKYKHIERVAGPCGFTIMEVMIAIVVLSVGLLAAGLMQIQAVKTNARSRDVTEAMYLAQGVVELIKAVPYDDGNYLSDVTGDGDPNAALEEREKNLNQVEDDADYRLTRGRYTLYWNVIEDYPVSNTKTIRVLTVNTDSLVRVRQIYSDGTSAWSYPYIDYIASQSTSEP